MIKDDNLPVGVVASGGQSIRMGSDKSFLNYSGKPQLYHLFEMLQPFCRKVFISCNENQSKIISKDYDFISDKNHYAGHGPVSGLMSCIEEFPEEAILFIGCDYSYLNAEGIKYLLKKRSNVNIATAYMNPDSKIPEPLLAIYEPASFIHIRKRFEEGKYSLREFLASSNTELVNPLDMNILKSFDTPEEFRSYSPA